MDHISYLLPVPSLTCGLVEMRGYSALGLQGPAEDISVLVPASALTHDGMEINELIAKILYIIKKSTYLSFHFFFLMSQCYKGNGFKSQLVLPCG